MQPATLNAQRAVATYAAMQRWLTVPDGHGLYAETAPPSGDHDAEPVPPSGNRYAYLWPYSRALLGTLCLAGVPGWRDQAAVTDCLRGLAAYWDGSGRAPAYASYIMPPLGPGGDRYADDNAWVALALILHTRLGLGSALRRAADLFAFGHAGWNTNPRDPRPGGIFWVEQGRGLGRTNHDRGAGATAGTAALGFHLHELTGSAVFDGDGEAIARPRALGARNMLDWVRLHLDSEQAGHGPYWNVVRHDGSIDTNLWSYNQGVVLGACVLQHRLTGSVEHLEQAERIAVRTLETFGTFRNHPPSFNAMCFQNLLMLVALTHDAALSGRVLETLHAYANWTWDPATGARDPHTNLFAFTDDGRPAIGHQPATLQDQGAMIQLYALLAWDPADYARLT